MNNFTKAIITLEFDKILELLASVCQTEGAREKCYTLTPETDFDRVSLLLSQTSDAKKLASLKGTPSFGGIKDINPSLERAAKGATLSMKELLDIADVLRTSRSLLDYINDGRRDGEQTSIDVIFSRLYSLRNLEEKIYRIIISEEMIADEASPALSEIRRKKRVVSNKIKDTLSQFTSGKYTKFLQENIITQRGGRYVVPVKSEYRNEVKGLSHDISASGATIFIEPMAVVEANNSLRELEAQEKHEIERILSELSKDCAENSGVISLNYYNITELAFIFARAELSFKMNGSEAVLSKKRKIVLNHARHPLLNQSTVVPVSLTLGEDYDTLVITGPNTGGKTVTLKTIGLLSLMTQAGLHIPADETSVMPVFSDILADIGDEQSIEQSLSTFSAHMTNIVLILESASEGSLVLFDELCTGTDPVEGAALAQAILENVRIGGSLCAATTHYAELKEYALNTDGVCNASCEFDIETLRPTYRLIIGTPGRSNAFAISERLGLPSGVIASAQKLVSSNSRKFEDTIDRLESTRMKLESSRDETEKMKREYAEYKAKAEKEIAEKTAKATKELEKAHAKAQQMIESARVSSDFVFSQLAELKKARDAGRYSDYMEEKRNEIRRSLRKAEDKNNPVIKNIQAENYKPPRPYKKGDEVLVVSMKSSGIITNNPSPDGTVNVQIGIINTKTNISNLMLVDGENVVSTKKESSDKNYSSFHRTVRDDFSYELDIRGMNGEEGMLAVDKYLDEANLVHLKTVHIVHGKGTGALRKAIQDFLKTDKRVKSFRLGQYGEGDSGVTVVELK